MYTRNELTDTFIAGGKDFDRRKFQLVRVAGYTTVKAFKALDHRKDKRDLDYRAALYWNPTVVIDEEEENLIDFYTADLPTTYRVVVEGLTESGQPVRGVLYLKVVNQ